MLSKKKICYLVLSDDIISKSNFELIKKASKLGKVIVGVLSDKVISQYKSQTKFKYEYRKILASNLANVHKVIKEDDRDYKKNLNIIRPDFVIHKKNYWNKGVQKNVREVIINQLKKWSGKLIELKVENLPDDEFIKMDKNLRINKLRRLVESKKIVRCLEAHNSLSALIVEKINVKKREKIEEFDAIWCSSLADSTIRGKPDNHSVDLSTRINSLNDILEITSKPILFDADNGGSAEQLPYTIKNLERMGISAIVMEDKIGTKINSLSKNQHKSRQDSIKKFSKKIKIACNSRSIKDLLVVARIESFILKKGLNDALRRANAYSRAGADLILIHSKSKTPKEIYAFAKIFSKSKFYKPLICVPSTYSNTSENELIKHNFKIVIYANQLLRSVYPAMINTAKSILKNNKSKNAESKISSIREILNIIN